MATTIIAGDFVKLRVVTYAPPQVAINVLHFVVTNVVGTPDYETLTPTWDAAIAPLYKALMSDRASYRGIGLSRLNPLAPTTEFVSIGNDGAGASANALMPRNVCGVITKRSGIPGPANRGRMFVAFPSEAMNATDGEPENGYVINLQALAAVLLQPQVLTSGLDSATFSPVIRHGTTLLKADVTSYLARQKWGSLHKRGDYGKPNVLPF